MVSHYTTSQYLTRFYDIFKQCHCLRMMIFVPWTVFLDLSLSFHNFLTMKCHPPSMLHPRPRWLWVLLSLICTHMVQLIFSNLISLIKLQAVYNPYAMQVLCHFFRHLCQSQIHPEYTMLAHPLVGLLHCSLSIPNVNLRYLLLNICGLIELRRENKLAYRHCSLQWVCYSHHVL